MDGASLLTGGGVAGLLMALTYVGRLALDWWKSRNDAPLKRGASAMSDASAANATLLQALRSLQKENARMAHRIDVLTRQDEVKDRKIEELQNRLNDIQRELSALRSGH